MGESICFPHSVMATCVVLLLTVVAGVVVADDNQQTVTDAALAYRIEALEDIVRQQAKVIDDLASGLQRALTGLEACSPLKNTFPLVDTADKIEGTGLLQEQLTGNSALHAVFVRSDINDPLVPVVTQLTERVNEVSASLQALKNEVTEASTSVFVHWGSSTCPGSSVLVYSGVVGGSNYNETGGAANYLCLPLSNITLFDYTNYHTAHLYGGEYQTEDIHGDKDPLCAVCRSSRATNVMIPATFYCPDGWTSEYSGWLMTGYYDLESASEFICVSFEKEERQGSGVNNNGKLLFYTATVCGSLPCPPYFGGKRVTCVVCSK
ncbi:uncharacterized protein LOC112564371 [Pomacea canaliculata]|uniref:uncharacterized protein LOC112564371 n=1 Tax=Pomacea canaliculata TaxID=400727 RepID=UPI000D73CC8F|nr:uncharacterized protein LOC112564371 [Pomacea canaliculata]